MLEISLAAQKQLEWPLLLQHLSSYAQHELSQTALLNWSFFKHQEELDEHHIKLEETCRFLDSYQKPNLSGIRSLTQELQALEKEAVLPGTSLVQIYCVAEALVRLRQQAMLMTQTHTHIKQRLLDILPFNEIANEINRCIDPNGEIKDNASALLARLRAQSQQSHRELSEKYHQLLNELDKLGVLSDRFVSIRHARFVIPVKAGEQNRVAGIVHDASQTGQTVFIEPQSCIEHGNKLKIIQIKIQEEEFNVLKKLSSLIGRYTKDLSQGIECATEIDILFSQAQFTATIAGKKPQFDPQAQSFKLYKARHPLLCLNGQNVVDNDLILDESERALIISGPNTGGKTAALKTIGILCLMAHAGLFVSAHEDSVVPRFKSIATVIGDAQSLSQSLSTFSSHIKDIKDIVATQKKYQHKSLVLLDELCADTDPQLGVALAQAILETLIEQGACLVVTTHYRDLAMLAYQDKRLCSAAFIYDFENMKPTYLLRKGIIGLSSPLEVATHLGLDIDVIKRARALTTHQDTRIQQCIEQLEHEKIKLADERTQIQAQQEQLIRMQQRTQEELRNIQKQRQDNLSETKNQLNKEITNSEQALKQIIADIQSGILAQAEHLSAKKAMNQVDLAKTHLNTLKKEIFAQNIESQQTTTKHDSLDQKKSESVHFYVGQKVTAPNLAHSSQGEIIDLDEVSQYALVTFGQLRTRMAFSELKPWSKKAAKKTMIAKVGQKNNTEEESNVQQGHFLDVRGERAQDALVKLEKALDQAYRQDLKTLTIIHGHGTGALKQSVREYLSFSPYIIAYKPQLDHEGRDGMTEVTL